MKTNRTRLSELEAFIVNVKSKKRNGGSKWSIEFNNFASKQEFNEFLDILYKKMDEINKDISQHLLSPSIYVCSCNTKLIFNLMLLDG